ncbi:MAG TPA: S1 RNA-binding domain-containing protein [Chloroflexota bacterium]|nr:S1 RNA-binding domain-containing protein [Chloroflexota bacterium]HUM69706.1 S1 RNA-binding domain-containing protein [Chloroflexota bacterium]
MPVSPVEDDQFTPELEALNHVLPLPVAEEPSREDAWQMAWEMFDADEAIETAVTGFNKGGLLINWYGLQGFVPSSQLIDFPPHRQEAERVRALQRWQNKSLRLKIIEINDEQNRLILSERAALVKADEREQVFKNMAPGRRVQGEVTNLTDFGAFVDLGGVEGLIHISELSWSRVTHPSDVVQPGQHVTVRVLSVDPGNGRIALSLKRLKSDPWQTVDQRFQPGQIIEGVVSKVVNFGAFVQIEDELEGLIHISELAEGAFLHPRNVVRRGQTVRARILYVDGDAKRLALSLRGVSG